MACNDSINLNGCNGCTCPTTAPRRSRSWSARRAGQSCPPRWSALKNPVPFTDFISLRRGIVGLGAWEIAARLPYIDLRNPGRLQPSRYVQNTNNSGNGTLSNLTLGGTWFRSYHIKVQFDWVYAMLDNVQRRASVASNYMSRVQVDF